MQKVRHPSYPIKSNLTIASLIDTLSSLEHPKFNTEGPNQIQKELTTFYPQTWNFKAKAHSASQQSHNSKVWGWKYGYRGTFPLFLTTSLNFLFSVTVDRNFRPVKPHFPHKAETWEQKPTKLGNILTILNIRGGNMGTGNLSSLSHNLSQFPLLGNCGSKFRTCYIFMLFLHFCYWHFDSLLSKHH